MEVSIIRSVKKTALHLSLPTEYQPICKARIKGNIELVPSTTDERLCVKCLTRSYKFNLRFRKKK